MYGILIVFPRKSDHNSLSYMPNLGFGWRMEWSERNAVSLAESISTRLSAVSSASDDSSEMATFREYLLDSGIASPVTEKAAGNMYDQELARQLAEFLERVLPRSGGMMALVGVYCIFNRARGVALVSLEDLVRACQLFEKLALPYRLRRFDSGLLVLQSQTHHDDDTQTAKNRPTGGERKQSCLKFKFA
ncbi:hypothetical protein SeLEV6574_g06095 [Synchytrium endobioticum]|uniref:Vacuolar protein-sorting-associated protein 36 n=1 Tax=Synchytrium endobioticum TaxID=286115 RepID=A0A507CQM0_9FUNG|nr:hypothetical protein SeLEV6574_g06095 [Synchytrium endobioticum]